MSRFLAQFNGTLTGLVQWQPLTALLQQSNTDEWFVYYFGESVPTKPCTTQEFERFLSWIGALLRRDNQERYSVLTPRTVPSLPDGSYTGSHSPRIGVRINTQLEGTMEQARTLWYEERDIAALRNDMLRFAKLQLRDAAEAEDAVQEALSAAYASRERFSGRSQVKTWVFSILRHKIIDLLRDRVRHPTQSLTRDDGSDTELNELFDAKGYWRKEERPTDWGDPEAALGNEQFWRVFDICLNAMAENLARVFTMREFLGLETAEICNELDISESNCWVILHRARSRLRRCLEENWMGSE